MNDLKPVIAHNIVSLRQQQGLTQLELAQRLNYSDKAVSKWERGESLPDITVLKALADLFGVTVDHLLQADHTEAAAPEPEHVRKTRSHGFIAGMCVTTVWLVATLVFVVLASVGLEANVEWLPFLYAVPVSMIVWLVLNCVWFDAHRNFLIVSLLMWTTLAALYVTLRWQGFEQWRIFCLAIPGQAIIILWSFLDRKRYR